MLATFTPAIKTPLTFEQAAEALRAALASNMTARPTDDVLALALAKSAFETARWKSIWCDNFGNIKAGDTYVGMFCAFACGENLADGAHWFEPDGTDKNLTKGTVKGKGTFEVPPGHPQTRFRAYANHFDGAFSYVDLVAGGYYAQAWKALLTGDARAFVHQLKAKGYFTGPEDAYAAGVISMQKEFVAKLKGLSPEPAGVDWGAAQASVQSFNHWDELTMKLYQGLDLTHRDDDSDPPDPEVA